MANPADSLELRREDLASKVARRLIEALDSELTEQYPEPDATHFDLAANEVTGTSGTFLVAYLDGKPVACGALRVIEAGIGEIKRMYVAPALRGNGIAHAVLAALEAQARKLGMRRLVLETGKRQLAALALYRNGGFVTIPCFGEYLRSPLSVCMAKDLL